MEVNRGIMCLATVVSLYMFNRALDGHLHFNAWVVPVVHQLEIVIAKVVDLFQAFALLDTEGGEGIGLASQLLLEWLDVVQVDVRVAHHVNELARLEAAHARDHVRQQRITGNIERYA